MINSRFGPARFISGGGGGGWVAERRTFFTMEACLCMMMYYFGWLVIISKVGAGGMHANISMTFQKYWPNESALRDSEFFPAWCCASASSVLYFRS